MDQPAIVIITAYHDDGEDLIIGPFPTGNDASNWAFRNLPLGMQWYWLPLVSTEAAISLTNRS